MSRRSESCQPIIVHHMANMDERHAPPNSLEAILACMNAGARCIEIDVNALASADYLVMHGPRLDKETSGSGSPRDCTPSNARQLCFRDENGQITTHGVPFLSDVVTLLKAYSNPAQLQIDFKDVIPFSDDEPLERLARIIKPLGDHVIVSSQADWQLRRLRRIAPWLRLGFDIHFYINWRPDDYTHPSEYDIPPYSKGVYGYWDDHLMAKQPATSHAVYLADRCEMLMRHVPEVDTLYANHEFLARSLDDGFNWAHELAREGIGINTFTIDAHQTRAVKNAKRLCAAGVTHFTTNTPAALSELLTG